MNVFTKLGLASLVIILSSGMLWATNITQNKVAHKTETSVQAVTGNQILDLDPNAHSTGITSTSDAQFDLQFSWAEGVGGGEAGLETDGNYVYTTKWNGAGEFYQYGMDGTYIGVITISGASGIRDLAYNGTYFYGGAGATTVFEVDIENATLISQFTAPTPVRAIAYNEDDDVFYANNWSTDIYAFDPSGASMGSFATGPYGASYYGFAYDNYNGAQYLWGYAQVGTTPADQNWLVQIELPSGVETGVTFNVATLVTPVTGIAGGLCVTNEVVPGYWTIMGNMQNEFIWGLELYDDGGSSSALFADDFEAYTAGQQLACQNPTDWTTWSNLPCDATEDGYVSDNFAYSGANSVNIVTDNDQVKNLDTYLTSGKYKVSLMMYVPTGNDGYYNVMSDFDGAYEWGFEVYFNVGGDGSVNGGATGAATFNYNFDTWMLSELVVDLDNDWAQYYLDGTMIHEWQWTLGADGTGAQLQLAACDFFGATATTSFYFDDFMIEDVANPPSLDPPTNLVATVVGPDDNDVELTWDAPAGAMGEWIQWDDGVNDDGVGLTNGGTYYGASHWMPADLTAYDGMEITKISFFPFGDPDATYTLMAWTGANAGTQILTQDITTFTVDEFNEVVLSTPITINASDELWFGMQVVHGAGTAPLGVDVGPAIAGSGDMISFDGTTWVSMSIEYSINVNWNLAAYVVATDASYAPVPMVKSVCQNTNTAITTSGVGGNNIKFQPSSSKALTGYNVYRNGSMIQFVTQTNTMDMDLDPGTYDYYVTAVYDEGESDPTNTESVTIEGGTGGDIFCDDFEAYTVGQQLVSQNSTDWTTWSNNPGSTEDPYIVDNGSNVVEITGVNDLVYPIANYTTGAYQISFDIYIPTGADGYFNTLQEFNGASSQYGMQVYFGETNPGEGNIDGGAALAQVFTFDYDTWMNVKVMVDLNNDWAEFYLDDVLIHGWVWSSGPFGTGTLNQLGGNDFFAWDGGAYANPLFHFDNYCLTELNNEVLNPAQNVSATLEEPNDILVDWDAPDMGALTDFTDDFESYDDFVLEFSPWTTIDVDGSGTYGMTGITWPNSFDPQAFIIFNPSMTTPAVTDITPHSGDKLAACFASTTPDNDDWMISPKVLVESGNQISFWVKSYTADYGLERYKVGISTTGTDPSDFTIVSGTGYLEAPATDWEEYTYDLSSYVGDEIYVGIECVSSDAFIFLVDDFSVTSGKSSIAFNTNTAATGNATREMNANTVPGTPGTVYGGQNAKSVTATLEGYNVYRDGDEIAYVDIPTTEYLDENLDPGTYTYCIKAVYTEGMSPEACADDVTVPNPAPPAPPSNLQLAVNNTDIDLTWDVPGNEWIQWDQGVNNGNAIGLSGAGGGTFSVASHWSPTDLGPYNGLSIETISFFANDVGTFTLKVWTGSNGLTEVYSQDVSNVTTGDWNEVALTTPVTIDANNHLWFGYEVTHDEGIFPAGCDDGPALLGKGDMILSGGAWVDLVSLLATLDYNWNLAAFVVAADGKTQMLGKPVTPSTTIGEFAESGTTGVPNKFNPSGSKDLTGYNVYYSFNGGASSVLDFVTTNSYTHANAATIIGEHCYEITAVYDPQGESVPSNEECETIISVTEFGNNSTQIYPNPASDVVNIKSDYTINSITIYNYSGQIVSKEQAGNKVYSVNTSKFQSGIYFFQIDTDQGRISQRIVIE